MTDYKAIAEDNGQTITVIEIQHWINAATLAEPRRRIPGMKSLRRADTNSAMNLLEDGRLQEIGTDRIFRRV